MGLAVILYLGFVSVTILHRALSHQNNAGIEKKHMLRDVRRERRAAVPLSEEDGKRYALYDYFYVFKISYVTAVVYRHCTEKSTQQEKTINFSIFR